MNVTCVHCKNTSEKSFFFRVEYKETNTYDITGIDVCCECWNENLKYLFLASYREMYDCHDMSMCSCCTKRIIFFDDKKIWNFLAVCTLDNSHSGWQYAFCKNCYMKHIGIVKDEWAKNPMWSK
jgi:hypothetical protein